MDKQDQIKVHGLFLFIDNKSCFDWKTATLCHLHIVWGYFV